jgi:hypothetical protein
MHNGDHLPDDHGWHVYHFFGKIRWWVILSLGKSWPVGLKKGIGPWCILHCRCFVGVGVSSRRPFFLGHSLTHTNCVGTDFFCKSVLLNFYVRSTWIREM